MFVRVQFKSLILLKKKPKKPNKSKPNPNHPLEAENPSTNDFRREKPIAKELSVYLWADNTGKGEKQDPFFLNHSSPHMCKRAPQFSSERLFKTRGNTLFHIYLLLSESEYH